MCTMTTLNQHKGNIPSLTYNANKSLLQQLRDKNWRVRQRAIADLFGTQDQHHIDSIIPHLGDFHSAVRTATIKTLVSSGEIAIPYLLDALNYAQNPLVQANCARVLGQIGDTIALYPLIAKLQSAEEEIRQAGATALGFLRSPQAVDPLISILDAEKSPAVLQAIIKSLGRLTDPKAVDPLINLLQHPNQMVLLAVIWALAKIKDPRAISPMIETLRRQCLNPQNKIKYEEEKFLNKADVAAQAFIYGGGHSNMPENIAAMISRFGTISIDPLKALLQDDNISIRLYATFALGEIRHSQTLEALILQLKDPSSDVRYVAYAALCKIGDPNIVALLTPALNDPDERVRLIAAAGLNSLKN